MTTKTVLSVFFFICSLRASSREIFRTLLMALLPCCSRVLLLWKNVRPFFIQLQTSMWSELDTTQLRLVNPFFHIVVPMIGLASGQVSNLSD